MGKIICECGHNHSDTCGYDGHLFKYDEWVDDDIYPLSVFECPECGNLIIDNPKNISEMITYKPENKKHNNLLLS